MKGPPPAAQLTAPLSSIDCEPAEMHWKSAAEIDTLAAYQDHLARLPICAFATLAKLRLDALAKKP